VFWVLILFIYTGYSVGVGFTHDIATSNRPNIIIFLVDDMGFGDIGIYGNSVIKTPKLDRMAMEGVYFNEFYAPSSVCSPSRAGLLTGRYPIRYGMSHGAFHPDSQSGLPTDEVTLANFLKSSGYKTAIFGKWHLGHLKKYLPLQRGFDVFDGLPFSNNMQVNARYAGNKIIDFDPDQRFFTRIFTDGAIKFIEKNKENKFFVLISHPMPHVPLNVSPAFSDKSRGGLYGDVIEEIDWSVGRVREKLEELGLTENTFVFFTSDNGPWEFFEKHAGSTGGLRGGKFTTFEGGVRVPAIAVWPGKIKSKRVQSGIFSSLDLLPTIANWANISLPKDRKFDGEDVSQIILGNKPYTKGRDFAYYSYGKPNLQAFRSEDWKLVLPAEGRYKNLINIGWPGAFPDHELMLFNLVNDPSESTNLAKKFPAKVMELKARMKNFVKDIGPISHPMNMGKPFNGHTPDLEGAQKPYNDSLDYINQAILKRKTVLGVVSGSK